MNNTNTNTKETTMESLNAMARKAARDAYEQFPALPLADVRFVGRFVSVAVHAARECIAAGLEPNWNIIFAEAAKLAK